LTYSGPVASTLRRPARRDQGVLVIGATFGPVPKTRDPDAAERRYYARTSTVHGTHEVQMLTADEPWTRFGAPVHAWLPIAVDASLRVRAGG
ncbi:MAG: hypothetical protein ACXVKQ_07440, partial [Acidimicrobiia bacterium]